MNGKVVVKEGRKIYRREVTALADPDAKFRGKIYDWLCNEQRQQ